jgi:cation:H+ antiporter
MSILTIVLFVLGIFLLIFGADLLVRGAAQIATAAGIPALIVGLTIVALGTSSPELAVSIQAALADQSEITLGNIVGSNIANLLLILGVAALIGPLPVARQILQRDLPIMIVVSVIVLLLSLNGVLSRLDGTLLLIGLAIYLFVTVRGARVGTPPPNEIDLELRRRGRQPMALLTNIALVAGGLALLIVGANWLVDGAVAFAAALGVSQLIIGLTVVAVGTSLPEIATTVIAGLRGERDIAVGNVVGSNLLNLLCVLGLTVLIDPNGIMVPASAIRLDLPVMVGAAALCAPLFFTRQLVSRREGWLLLVYYVAYTLYLVLDAVSFRWLDSYAALLGLVVLPVTLTIVTVRVLRELRIQQVEQQARLSGED